MLCNMHWFYLLSKKLYVIRKCLLSVKIYVFIIYHKLTRRQSLLRCHPTVRKSFSLPLITCSKLPISDTRGSEQGAASLLFSICLYSLLSTLKVPGSSLEVRLSTFCLVLYRIWILPISGRKT